MSVSARSLVWKLMLVRRIPEFSGEVLVTCRVTWNLLPPAWPPSLSGVAGSSAIITKFENSTSALAPIGAGGVRLPVSSNGSSAFTLLERPAGRFDGARSLT